MGQIHSRITPILVIEEHSHHQMIPISEILVRSLAVEMTNHPLNDVLTVPLDEISPILEAQISQDFDFRQAPTKQKENAMLDQITLKYLLFFFRLHGDIFR